MAYDEELAERVRHYLRRKHIAFDERRMMEGLCFMVDGKMCLGVEKNRLMLRLSPAEAEALIDLPGAAPMDFTGRPMKGFLWIYEEGFGSSQDFAFWLDHALAFNPLAKASRKKKK